MENKKPVSDVNINGLRTKLSSTEAHHSANGAPDSFRRINDNGSQHVKNDMNSPQSSQRKSFKSVVQRHFVKDKLFFLVHDLLKSIDDEKQAQEDLIASFQTAREVTEPIRKQAVAATAHRVKRRRKRDDKPLLERIERTRKESLQPLEHIQIYNKNTAAVGELKLKANEVGDYERENDSGIVDQSEEEHLTSSMKPPSATEKDNVKVSSGKNKDSEIHKQFGGDTDSASSKTHRRPKSSPAGESEKLSAIYQLNKDENASEVDQLILNSVHQENETIEEDNTEHLERDTSEKVEDSGTKNVDDTESSELTVEVESNAESDQDETNIKVIGSNDEIEDDDLDEDDDCEFDEFKKLNDPNFCVSVMEFNRAPASLHPGLDSIAEASSESFQSMPSSSRDTSSVIEIEAKKSSLPWRDNGIVTHTFSESNKIDKQANRDNALEVNYLNKLDSRQSSTTELNKNRDLTIQGKEENNNNGQSNITGHKTHRDKPNVNYAEYCYTKHSNDKEEKSRAKYDTSFASTKHRPGKTTHENSKSSTHRRKAHHKDYSYNNFNDVKQANGEAGKKKKSKSKNLISIDLLGLYEDNTDLQRISRSELNTPQPEKEKLKGSPKRSRSASPKKKGGHERKRHELKPLPSKMTTSLENRKKFIFTSHRSKAELSSRSSSTSSFEDMKDPYKTLQSLKDERRYRKPDAILWERLEISEMETKDRHDRVRWADRFNEKYRYSGSTEEDTTDNVGMDGRRVTWNIPITEQIKNITGSKNVPDITKLSHTIPREERVGRLYIDLKQERRASGYADYRRLSVPEQKEEIDEFTHL